MATLGEVAGRLGARVVRDGAFTSIGFIQHRWPGRLTFVESPVAAGRLESATGCTCVLASPEVAGAIPEVLGLAIVASPRRAFFALHEYLVAETSFYGTAAPSLVSATARVHPTAFVADTGVRIADQVVVEPNATILAGVDIGSESVIRAGTVVGAEGFQVTIDGGRAQRMAHAGRVRIGSRVEIQSNCCIDRALFGGYTSIGDETTIDKLVYVAHHVDVGRACRIGAGAILNGSVTVGDGTWIGPNATISDGLVIGAGAAVSLGSVVTRDVAPGVRVTGNFALPHDRFLEAIRRDR